MISSVHYSAKSRLMETVKGVVIAKDWREEEGVGGLRGE